jgi:hypothetical protein
MITNDTFYGLVFERDRVRTLLDHCPEYVLSAILAYIIDRRFSGWNKADVCFRVSPFDTNSDRLYEFFQNGKITFEDLLAAYNWVTYSSINPKYESYYVPAGTLVEDDTPALTDDFEEAPKTDKPLKITNPRWEHKDEEKVNNSPDIAENANSIILKADLENYTENATVQFDIYDTSQKPPKRIAHINGKNIRNVATGEWKVSFKQDHLPELEFDASAYSETTSRCPIAIKSVGRILVVLNEDGTTVLPYYEFLLYEGTECHLYAESDSNGEFVLPDNIGDIFDVQVIGPGKHHPLWNQLNVFDGELPPEEVVPVEQCIDEEEDTLSED